MICNVCNTEIADTDGISLTIAHGNGETEKLITCQRCSEACMADVDILRALKCHIKQREPMIEAVTDYARAFDMSQPAPLTKSEIHRLKALTHRDCRNVILPSRDMDTEEFDQVGWCREGEIFVWCNESIFDAGCECFEED